MKLLIIILFLQVQLSDFTFTQELIWKHLNGPMGGVIGDIAINSKDIIYAGVYGSFGGHFGLYKSIDNGNNWNKLKTQFDDFSVYTIYLTGEDHIWVGTDHQDRIYHSTDDGETWAIKNNGYITNECWAFGESLNGYIFAGNADGGGLFRSSNYGADWDHISNISPLVITTDSNNVIYVGTFSGLYLSSNNGITWVQDSFLQNIAISSIIIDDRNNIYCGTGYYSNGDGVYYSSDGGQSWIQLGLGGVVVLSLAIDSYGNLYAGTLTDGLFKTTDMGKNWTQHQEGLYKKQVYRIKLNRQDDIFVGSEGGGLGWYFYGGGGVFRSTNNGYSFKHIGLPISLAKNIIFSGDSLIITSTPSGVQKYNRFTSEWKNLGLHNVEAITITPSNFLYAASRDEGLFKSTDFGKSWEIINIAIDSITPVFNVLSINDDTIFVSTAFWLNFRGTTDGGQTWNIFPIRTGETSRGLIFKDNTLFVTGLAAGSLTLYKSNNFGLSFDSLYFGFDTGQLNNPISVTNNGYIFLASRGSISEGILRSSNNGLNWSQILFNNVSTTVFANDNGMVITGSAIFGPSDTNKIYISNDFGNSWSIISEPLHKGIYIADIKQDAQGNFFFATSAEGLYEVDIITNVEDEPVYLNGFYLSQNYPNPFNPSTNINYEIPERSFVTIKVYDILGREVKTLVSAEKPAGRYDIKFDGKDLPSSVYFYELVTDKTRITKKMILLR